MYSGPIQKDLGTTTDDFRKTVGVVQDLRVRLIGVRDQFSDFRLSWLSSIFLKIEVFDFNSQETYAISVAERDYDVLFVGANDALRVAKFVRSNAPLLANRASFALIDQADPQRRARVLNAGFDDVFDLARTAPEEAIIRVAAVWRRYKMVEELKRAEFEKSAAVREIADGSELGRREILLLETLHEKLGRPVSYYSLMKICSNDYEVITFDHLKVLISNLRKKLNRSYKISAITGQGYILLKEG